MILCRVSSCIPNIHNTLLIKFLDGGERGEGGVLHIFQFFISSLPSVYLSLVAIGEKIDSVKIKSPSNFSCSKFSSSFLFILLSKLKYVFKWYSLH